MPKMLMGAVTFLCTDIAGSTRRWEDAPAAMASALQRHDTLIGDAIRAHHGAVFKTVGDAICAAFADPNDALAAAVAAQQALCAEPWGAFGAGFDALRVRMALRPGIPWVEGGADFGPPVNTIARLIGTTHTG